MKMKKNTKLVSYKELITFIVVALIFFGIGFFTNRSSVLKTFCRIAIMALYAISLNIQYGYGGMANLGSSLYFALSGYGMMVLVTKAGMSTGMAILVTIIIEIVFAFAFGYVTLQRGMMTFMFLNMGIVILAVAFVQKTEFLGGVQGLMATMNPKWLKDMNIRYVFVVGICLICSFILYLMTKSPMVSVLKGARDNEERLLFLGINSKKLRLVVFVITSVFMGISGFLYTIVFNNMNPKMLDSAISIQALVMCILGGSSMFLGPVLGSILVTLVVTYAPLFTRFHQSVLAIIMLLCIYFAPRGLLPILKNLVTGKYFKKAKVPGKEAV